MKNTLTYKEAFDLYLKEGYDNIMPFDDSHEGTFVELLQARGYTIISEDELSEVLADIWEDEGIPDPDPIN